MTDISKFDPLSNEPRFQVIGICGSCIWQRKNPMTCRAFPDGIPVEILVGDVLHVDPYPGDNGVQFRRKGPQGIS